MIRVWVRSMWSFLKSTRFWLAGPVALLLSICFMASMSLWLPAGEAGIDHLVVPIVLFPFLWAAAFFYAVLDLNTKRAAVLMLVALLISAGLVIASIAGLL